MSILGVVSQKSMQSRIYQLLQLNNERIHTERNFPWKIENLNPKEVLCVVAITLLRDLGPIHHKAIDKWACQLPSLKNAFDKVYRCFFEILKNSKQFVGEDRTFFPQASECMNSYFSRGESTRPIVAFLRRGSYYLVRNWSKAMDICLTFERGSKDWEALQEEETRALRGIYLLVERTEKIFKQITTKALNTQALFPIEEEKKEVEPISDYGEKRETMPIHWEDSDKLCVAQALYKSFSYENLSLSSLSSLWRIFSIWSQRFSEEHRVFQKCKSIEKEIGLYPIFGGIDREVTEDPVDKGISLSFYSYLIERTLQYIEKVLEISFSSSLGKLLQAHLSVENLQDKDSFYGKERVRSDVLYYLSKDRETFMFYPFENWKRPSQFLLQSFQLYYFCACKYQIAKKEREELLKIILERDPKWRTSSFALFERERDSYYWDLAEEGEDSLNFRQSIGQLSEQRKPWALYKEKIKEACFGKEEEKKGSEEIPSFASPQFFPFLCLFLEVHETYKGNNIGQDILTHLSSSLRYFLLSTCGFWDKDFFMKSISYIYQVFEYFIPSDLSFLSEVIFYRDKNKNPDLQELLSQEKFVSPGLISFQKIITSIKKIDNICHCHQFESDCFDVLLFLIENPFREIYRDLFIELSQLEGMHLDMTLVKDFCYNNSQLDTQIEAARWKVKVFIEIYQSIAEKMKDLFPKAPDEPLLDKETFSNTCSFIIQLEKIFLSPVITLSNEVVYKLKEAKEGKIDFFFEKMYPYKDKITGPDFYEMARRFFLGWIQRVHFLLLEDHAKLGVQEITYDLLVEIFLQPLSNQAPIKEGGAGITLDRARELAQRKIQSVLLQSLEAGFSEAKRVLIYFEWVSLYIQGKGKVIEEASLLIGEIQKWVGPLNSNTIYALFLYHPEALQELRECVAIRQTIMTQDVMHFILEPTLRRNFTDSIQRFCDKLASIDEIAATQVQLQQMLAYSFLPPIQPVTDILKIQSWDGKSGLITYQSDHIATHRGRVKSPFGRDYDGKSVSVLPKWIQIYDQAILHVCYYNFENRSARAFQLPLVSLPSLYNPPSFFSFLSDMALILLQEKVLEEDASELDFSIYQKKCGKFPKDLRFVTLTYFPKAEAIVFLYEHGLWKVEPTEIFSPSLKESVSELQRSLERDEGPWELKGISQKIEQLKKNFLKQRPSILPRIEYQEQVDIALSFLLQLKIQNRKALLESIYPMSEIEQNPDFVRMAAKGNIYPNSYWGVCSLVPPHFQNAVPSSFFIPDFNKDWKEWLERSKSLLQAPTKRAFLDLNLHVTPNGWEELSLPIEYEVREDLFGEEAEEKFFLEEEKTASKEFLPPLNVYVTWYVKLPEEGGGEFSFCLFFPKEVFEEDRRFETFYSFLNLSLKREVYAYFSQKISFQEQEKKEKEYLSKQEMPLSPSFKGYQIK